MSTTPESAPQGQQLDPALFACVNEYLEVTNRQARQQGDKRVSFAVLYAAARYNSHAFLGIAASPQTEREEFVAYMTDLYRRALEENLSNLINERAATGPSQAE
ncbi:DUF3144 domain-containing protein [Arenimonas oryziterrae]|uniref:DUF3144 domain-containing protein n=1 Tax=Arenimonas oryziterrae DSM 21050 = YC6267 TaxID=1121015 RepID=A0A091B1G8_9GAMM|nr:DUF3144 domain-containing protein [Arenimonas oryziterrae]KFN44749.1 hypothetical protein N789_01685 [Arenimonas oryziterrae DSM 21050 = YC6267]